ncbi:hypothetical protein EDD21DRAFT_366567 [Dissophora ornata]|nr:hypothetical protein BGZ58_009836 [Dissophora ornata]KAI8604334.1 hypothetical protein EDD21DRAFT_366567 [Dissophora ornata]
MPAHSSAQAICTRILIRARSRTALARRHQSTFSFFSRNQDSPASVLSTKPTRLDASETTTSSATYLPRYPNGLKTSSSFANAAPLLAAIQNKDQDTAWMVYSVLSRAGQLSTLLPIHHSLLLQNIRPQLSYRFTPEMAASLTERFEQVWTGMLQCHIQPDMNDYMARLELAVATWQYQMVDQTWAEMREKAGLSTASAAAASETSSSGNGSSVSVGSVIQPTLYTYNLILQSCVQRKNIGLAMETITLMRRAGVKPDNASWDFVLQIHTAMKNWPALESTFRSAFVTTAMTASSGAYSQQQQSQQQNTYNPPLASELMTIPLGQHARSLHGGAIIPSNNGNRFKEKLIPTLENVHTLFSYYAYTQDLEDLRHMFDSHVRLFGLVLTTRTYNEMIKFAFLAKRDRDALDLFRELVQIGQNLDKMQSKTTGHNNDAVDHYNGASVDFDASSTSQEDQHRHHGQSKAAPIKMQACGPNWDTFKILINNELIDARNRWGRAWKWIQVMQEAYGLEPSDRMYRRTLAAMRRSRGGRGADETTIKALQDNWDQVRIRREARIRAGTSVNARVAGNDDDDEDDEDEHEELVQVTSSS